MLDLQVLRDLGPENLRKVVLGVAKIPVAPVQPKELHDIIEEALDGDGGKAEVLLRQLLALHGMLRQLDLNPSEVFDGLNSSLQPLESGWNQEEYARWESVSGVFQELFELPIVRLSAKALDLSYEHPHVLQSTRIITDIRPIFDDGATQIEGSVISHNLVLRYNDMEGEHELSLSADEKDVKALIKQCERALRKTETAKVQLEEKAGLKTLVAGRD